MDNLEHLSSKEFIVIKNARVHNLKNLSVAIPRNKLVVITGLSGSGKSSLAFDTLYAEGQRRYVESLSAYARQFMGKMHKPEVDYIRGISPAIAIEQKVNSRNPRSTVGTSTEIYDYLKLLFARIGKTYSPVSGNLVKRNSVSDVTDFITALPPDTRILLLSPARVKPGRSLKEELNILLQKGFTRIEFMGEIRKIEEVMELNASPQQKEKDYKILIDRFVISSDMSEEISRISDSVQTAFFEGEGTCHVETVSSEGKTQKTFSNRFELDGISFEEPSVNLFSFNNPYGACKTCEGFGNVIGIDPDLVVPNKSLSIYEGAIACWRGDSMKEWNEKLVLSAYKFDFPIHKPFYQLTEEDKKLLWTGNKYFSGLNDFFRFIEEQTYKIQYRVMLSRYRGKTICPDCHGTRLRKDASYVKVSGRSIIDVVLMPVKESLPFFLNLDLSPAEQTISKRILIEITNRLQFLSDVGLDYLTLNRLSNTLSGGESQRINLATSLGSSLVGSMYILDEPSIGLHSRDTEKLIGVLQNLRKLGNSVLVVEHDEEIMRAADHLIDIGPEAGSLGGNLIFEGDFTTMMKDRTSLTARYLNGDEKIPVPPKRRKWKNFILLEGVRENNLKNLNVKIPLGILTAVTGVSGSGKTSLIKRVLYPALKKIHGGFGEFSGQFDNIGGNTDLVKAVEMVDQNPIGKSSRSNPVTYVKAYDEIRALFAEQGIARARGYKPSHFSFNVDGGRCEMCEGEGEVTIEMQFMADIHLVCETCGGKRFKQEILEIKYQDKNISDILEMTVDDAISFFTEGNNQKIVSKLQPLSEVGLGYIRLGQSSSTLSGGEAQRVKLAFFLAKGNAQDHTLFIFDEPTTGLHFHDINKLLKSFQALIEQGNSVIMIEHNLDMIKCADWVLDLGPEGGNEGGHLVFEGTPEDLAKEKSSYTGKYLGPRL